MVVSVATQMYRNVYATCRLICNNVIGSSHISSLYEDTLQILHIIMTRNNDFCLFRQLFDTIYGAKTKHSTILKLPCLVTLICGKLMTEFNFYLYFSQYTLVKRALISPSYHETVNEDWTLRLFEKNIFTMEDMEDITFFRKSSPTDRRQHMYHTWSELRRLWGECLTDLERE